MIVASRSPEKLRHAAVYLGDVRTIATDMTREADVAEVFRESGSRRSHLHFGRPF